MSSAACVDEAPPQIVPEPDAEPATSIAMTRLAQHHARARGYMPGDYDHDGRADIAFRRENGLWAIDYWADGFGSVSSFSPAGRGDIRVQPAPADYDGDGWLDVAVHADNGWWGIEYQTEDARWGVWDVTAPDPWYGARGIPVPGDYDGDGLGDRAMLTHNGVWLIDTQDTDFGAWDDALYHPGLEGAYPVPADYPYFANLSDPEMSGAVDVAIKGNDGVWLIDYAENGLDGWEASYGARGGAWSVPVPGDYDGDGLIDLAVKDDGGAWLIDHAVNGYAAWDVELAGYGDADAIPVPADYDGDKRMDLAVHSPCGVWYIDYSKGGFGQWDESVRTADVTAVRRTVYNAAELIDVLQTSFVGTIVLPAGITIDMTPFTERNALDPDDDRHFELPVRISSCVRIEGLGTGLAARATIKTDDASYRFEYGPPGMAGGYTLFEAQGDGVQVRNVHLRGPQAGRRQDLPFITGLGYVVYPGRGDRDVHIEDSELDEWPGAAIAIGGQIVSNGADRSGWGPTMTSADGEQIRIARNAIHHNSHDGRGYGVLVDSGAYTRIEHNVFTRNRHAIASNGFPHTGYMATENYVLEGGYMQGGYWNQHFDVHGSATGGYGGVAGEYFEVAGNTFRGEQEYYVIRTRPALMVRGTPSSGAHFYDNAAVHDGCGEAVRRDSNGNGDVGNVYCEDSENRFDFDASTDLGTGDFDGDGIADVFVGTGKTWWYSSGGATEWRYLNTAIERASELKFADIDADGTTDVIAQAASVIWWSQSGRAGWQALAPAWLDTPLSKLHIANFTGDARADIFRTTGAYWYLWEAHTSQWRQTQYAAIAFEDLRFGEFDATPGADVLARLGSAWHVASGSVVPWALHDATARVSNLRTTVAADFDGDGRTDLAWRSSNRWLSARGGRGAPVTLRTIAAMASCEYLWEPYQVPGPRPACPTYQEITQAVIGNFDGWAGADAIAIERGYRWRQGTSFGFWAEEPRLNLAWWSGWDGRFARRSGHEVR